jgi:VanZ like protein/concanavalin A-like lectin/glucanase superfamily protein
MKNIPRNGTSVWILYATTATVVLGILVTGLWPLRFHPPNNVSWIVARDGIRFGTHGSVVSSGQFRVPDDEAASPCSLELWLAPDFGSASSSILAFSTRSNPVQLQLIQSLDDLFVNKERADRQWRREAKHIAIVSLFQKNRSVFISISGDSGGTSVFIDGSLRRRSNEFRLTCESLTGTLVLANSPKQYAPWQGSIFALAVYRGSLDAATIRRHYRAFSSGTAMDGADLKNALAVYGFSERGGQLIRDQRRAEPDLTIPGSYSILYPPFLTPAWKEFAPTRWYVADLAVNIAGFVPPGFFICATLISLRGGKRSVGLATVSGLLLSLAIEILQAYIPMRNSGTTDLITNTLGTGIGAALYPYALRKWAIFRTT